jgi:hypothetical protein
MQPRRGRVFGRHPAAITRVFAQHQIAQQLQVFMPPTVTQPKQQSGWTIFLFFFDLLLARFFFWQMCPSLSLSFFLNLLLDRVVFCHPCVRLHVQQETTTRLAGTGPEVTGGSAQLLHLPAGRGSSSSKDDVAASVSTSASGVRSCDDPGSASDTHCVCHRRVVVVGCNSHSIPYLSLSFSQWVHFNTFFFLFLFSMCTCGEKGHSNCPA